MPRKYILAALVLTLAPVAPAQADLLAPPGQLIAGSTQGQLSAAWWQTMLGMPAANNPLTNPQGGVVPYGPNNSVLFLTGIAGQVYGSVSGVVNGTVNMYSNQTLFFPILNTVSWLPDNSKYPTAAQDAAAALGFAKSGASNTLAPTSNTTLNVKLTQGSTTLISESTATLFYFRQTSPGLFTINFPANNLIGPNAMTRQAASDGWYAAIGPLDPGVYTLSFGGSTTGSGVYSNLTSTEAITYTLNVQAAPEPSSLLLAGTAGLALVGGCFRRWKPKTSM